MNNIHEINNIQEINYNNFRANIDDNLLQIINNLSLDRTFYIERPIDQIIKVPIGVPIIEGVFYEYYNSYSDARAFIGSYATMHYNEEVVEVAVGVPIIEDYPGRVIVTGTRIVY